MIKLRDIRKSYGDLEVLKGVSLEVIRGEVLAIVGPSGAGKTTLLQIMGTLDRPDSGNVEYEGEELTTLNDKRLSLYRNRNIGFVFQFHQLLPEFTARENVAMPALIGGMSKGKSMKRAGELLELLGLGDRLRHKPGQLSGGERQRVALARALVNDPKVVFADEPTGSLDSQNRDEIIALILSLRDRLHQTFVIVTHDPTVAAVADRTVEMADGAVVAIKESRASRSGEPLRSGEPPSAQESRCAQEGGEGL